MLVCRNLFSILRVPILRVSLLRVPILRVPILRVPLLQEGLGEVIGSASPTRSSPSLTVVKR